MSLVASVGPEVLKISLRVGGAAKSRTERREKEKTGHQFGHLIVNSSPDFFFFFFSQPITSVS